MKWVDQASPGLSTAQVGPFTLSCYELAYKVDHTAHWQLLVGDFVIEEGLVKDLLGIEAARSAVKLALARHLDQVTRDLLG